MLNLEILTLVQILICISFIGLNFKTRLIGLIAILHLTISSFNIASSYFDLTSLSLSVFLSFLTTKLQHLYYQSPFIFYYNFPIAILV